MKYIKIYLGIVSVLLCVAIGFGVYIWYTIQNLTTQVPVPAHEQTQTSPQKEERTTPVVAKPVEETSQSAPDAPIILEASKLTPAQQEMLKTFGYSQDSFTITTEMTKCAADALGEVRLAEIMDGSAPSPLESLRLVPCFSK